MTRPESSHSKRVDIDVLRRESVQRIADIIGPSSAAAQALRCIKEEHGGKAEVCQPVGKATLIVVPHADLEAAGWMA